MSNKALLKEVEQSTNEQPSNTESLESNIDLSEQLPVFVELLPEQFRPYWSYLDNYPILEWLLILALFWGFAFIFRRYAIALIEHLTTKTKSDLDDNIIRELRGPFFNLVIWFGLIVASKSAGFDQGNLAFVVPLAMSLIVLSILRSSLGISELIIQAMSRDPLHFQKLNIRTEPLLIITSKIVLMIMAAYAVLIIWGINPLGLIASAGIVGIAVGFAAKDTLANLFSGVFILADGPYKLGDYVNLDSGERGKVSHIGIRSTRLLTRDDIEVTIPNGLMGNSKIVNESGGAAHKMRIRVDITCAYESNLDRVEEILMEIAQNEEKICDHPAPRVRFRNFGASGINIQLMGWINEPESRGLIIHLVMKAIHRAFDQHNIEIPYPRFVSIAQESNSQQVYSD